MNTFEVVQNFLVHGGKFLIYADRSVLVRLFTLRGVRAVSAVFAYINLILPSIEIALYCCPIGEVKFLVVRAAEISVGIGLLLPCTPTAYAAYGRLWNGKH